MYEERDKTLVIHSPLLSEINSILSFPPLLADLYIAPG